MSNETKIKQLMSDRMFLYTGSGPGAQRQARDMEVNASYYASGRLDADPACGVDPTEFALAYALHVLEYETRIRSSRMSVQGAWESYAECGRILWYGHIDRVTPRFQEESA